MENYIIAVILIILIFIGMYSATKHFKGKGGCCGGGGYKPKRKRLSGIIFNKTFKVDGMHCEHCKGRVEEVINDIKGIAGKVNLKKGILTVSYAENISNDLIIKRIEKAGYTATEIK